MNLTDAEIDEVCQAFRDGCSIEVNQISWEEIPEDWKNVFRMRMKSAIMWLNEKGKTP